MVLQVTCPCGQRFVAEPELAGKRVRCRACGEPIAVPAPKRDEPSAHEIPPLPDLPDETALPALHEGQAWDTAGLPTPRATPTRFTLKLGRKRIKLDANQALIAGAIGAVVLCVVIAGAWWGIGLLSRGVRDSLEPAWTPAPERIGQLAPEEKLGNYAIRPHPALQRQAGLSGPPESEVWIHDWFGSQLMMTIVLRPVAEGSSSNPRWLRRHGEDHVRRTRQMARTKLRGSPIVDYGRIGEFRCLRLSYQFETRGSLMTHGVVASAFNRLWMCQDNDTRILIQLASDYPFDGPESQLAETSIRTFRRLSPEELQEDAAPQGGWTPGASVATTGFRAGTLPRLPSPSPDGVLRASQISPTIRVPIPHSGGRLRYPPGLSSYIAVGNRVYDLAAGQRMATLSNATASHTSDGILSPDGKLIAGIHNGRFRAYRTQSSEELDHPKLEGEPGRIELVQFVGPSSVLVLVDGQAVVADLAAGRATSRFAVPERLQETAVTADGRYFAACTHSDLFVYDVAAGRQVARAQRPPSGQALPYAGCRKLAFSHDARELAALFDTRVVSWSHEGLVTSDHRLPKHWYRRGASDDGLDWVPGRRGWLLFGRYLFDRQAGRVVARIGSSPGSRAPPRFLDSHRLLVVAGRGLGEAELIDVAVPWQTIDASLGAMAAGNALLGPGKAVSLSIALGPVRFADPDAVRGELTATFTEVFKRHDVEVRPGAPLTLKVEYGESKGRRADYGRMLVPGVTVPGTKVSADETRGNIALALEAQGRGGALWAKGLESPRGLAFRGPVTDENVRDGMFEDLQKSLHEIEMPYFIPQASDLPALPLVIDLGS
jgi:hypothetical protein